MANYYTIVTPDEGLACSEHEAAEIAALLREDDDDPSGFDFVYEDGLGYLQAEESGNWDALPLPALHKIGLLIQRAGLPFLECGVAFTCGKLRPQSHGGTAFRILPDGQIVNRTETWEMT